MFVTDCLLLTFQKAHKHLQAFYVTGEYAALVVETKLEVVHSVSPYRVISLRKRCTVHGSLLRSVCHRVPRTGTPV